MLSRQYFDARQKNSMMNIITGTLPPIFEQNNQRQQLDKNFIGSSSRNQIKYSQIGNNIINDSQLSSKQNYRLESLSSLQNGISNENKNMRTIQNQSYTQNSPQISSRNIFENKYYQPQQKELYIPPSRQVTKSVPIDYSRVFGAPTELISMHGLKSHFYYEINQSRQLQNRLTRNREHSIF